MILSIIFLVFLIVIKLVVMLGFQLRFKDAKLLKDESLPKVSVLIPARNEEEHLPACLDSLIGLDYPLDQLEVLVGDDQSTDGTAQVIRQFAARYPHIRYTSISEDYFGLVARSNVLAQLAKEASGDYIVFLDADMEVSQGWLRQMVAPTAQGYELVSGYTEVTKNHWLAAVQQVDWLNVLMWLKVGADMNQPGTALGNNMLVKKAAYEAIGGYEAIGPTFTEDNDLTLKLRTKGHALFQVVTDEGAFTQPMKSFSDLWKQRKRWMSGAFRQPANKLLPVLVSRLFVLWVLLISLTDLDWALLLLFQVALLETALSAFMVIRTKTRISLFTAFIAPVFNSLLDTFTLLTYPLFKKLVWKGRKL